MKKWWFIVLPVFLLAGCPQHAPDKPGQVPITGPSDKTPTLPPKQPTEVVPPPETVPQPPKVVSIDWSASVSPLVASLVSKVETEGGNLLLVDSVKNNTNGSLQTDRATSALYNALSSNSVFTVISKEQADMARQALGLSTDDSLNTRSKSIGLARYINAQYVLYSTADGDVKEPKLELQLMLVKTGEIIWSGSGATVQE